MSDEISVTSLNKDFESIKKVDKNNRRYLKFIQFTWLANQT